MIYPASILWPHHVLWQAARHFMDFKQAGSSHKLAQHIRYWFYFCFLVVIWQTKTNATITRATAMSSVPCPVTSQLQALGIKLKGSKSKGATSPYGMCWKSGSLLHLCGHRPQREDGTLMMGTLGETLLLEDGYEAAELCAIQILNTLELELKGDWSKLVRIVKIVGFVSSANGFEEQSNVVDGACDLFTKVLGDRGGHVRSAVGLTKLPEGVAAEIECTVEIKQD